MTLPPARPCIYHITHIDNLPAIIAVGGLRCDTQMTAAGGPRMTIGMAHIKQRRLTIPMNCHPGDHVGDYVPFYFCPRSVMLYVISRGGSDDLTYGGGQEPVVHIEADLHTVVGWADRVGRRWAFSLCSAGAAYVVGRFRADVRSLDEINWPAVAATRWSAPDVKEGKQAEFLVRDTFPWSLVSRIGVRSMQIQERVEAALAAADHRPPVEVRPAWYY